MDDLAAAISPHLKLIVLAVNQMHDPRCVPKPLHFNQFWISGKVLSVAARSVFDEGSDLQLSLGMRRRTN